MKRMHRKLASIVAGVLCSSLLLPGLHAVAESDTIIIPDSAYLSDSVGTLSVNVTGDRDVRVLVEKHTLDGVIPYYDTILEEDGSYRFALDSCEYDVTQSEANGFLTPYNSFFTFTVQDVADPLCSYTAPSFVVLDPGFSLNFSSSSFRLTTTLEEGEARDVTEVATSTVVVDTVPAQWEGMAEVKLTYLVYTRGDVNANDAIDTFDAFAVLQYYARQSAGYEQVMFTDGSSVKAENAAFAAADVNRDDSIDTTDAFKILLYYASSAAGTPPSWGD